MESKNHQESRPEPGTFCDPGTFITELLFTRIQIWAKFTEHNA
jgi:hypothetical protein